MGPLDEELSFALGLVRECGVVAMRYWRKGPAVMGLRDKPLGGGPVTLADMEINERIVRPLGERFPADGVLAEESVDDGQWRGRSRCWYVDPIDGTREFARGRTGWTIQIGLCIDGEPVLGVVFEPAAGHLSWAVRTEARTVARHRGPRGVDRRLGPPKDVSLDTLRIIGGRLSPQSRQHAIHHCLGVTAERARSVGSVGVRLASVARADANVYVQAPGHTKMWDTCAPATLVLAAGGRVTDLRGCPLDFRAEAVTHPAGVVASPAHVHGAILDRVAPLAERWLGAPRTSW